MIKVCQNCGKEFNADKSYRKYCSMECRIVPPGVDLVGQKMGWLTVLKELERVRLKNGSPKRMFLCICKCGTHVERGWDGLYNTKTPSCGCFMSHFATNRIKHGMSKTKIFKVWAALKVRCYKKHDPTYKRYGAKGVTVCERWEYFENFYEDMGGTYKEGLTLDRYPNKKGNYEPGNCRWATYKQQNRNLTTNRMLAVGIYTYCVSEFAEILGIPKGRITGRLKLGWVEHDAVLGRVQKEQPFNYNKIKEYYEVNKE